MILTRAGRWFSGTPRAIVLAVIVRTTDEFESRLALEVDFTGIAETGTVREAIQDWARITTGFGWNERKYRMVGHEGISLCIGHTELETTHPCVPID